MKQYPEPKQRFDIGTKFRSAGKIPTICTVVDVYKTYNSAGRLVNIRYVAAHEFAGQVLYTRDIVDTTIAKRIIKDES